MSTHETPTDSRQDLLTATIIESQSWPESVAQEWQAVTDRILGRVVKFDPSEKKAIHDALYVLWCRTGVKANVLDNDVVVATTPDPPEEHDPSKGYCNPATGIQYPVNMYVDDRAMKALLKAHGVNVTKRELQEKAGIYWDGGPGDNKWYETLSHYNVAFPETKAFEAMDRADQGRPAYRVRDTRLVG